MLRVLQRKGVHIYEVKAAYTLIIHDPLTCKVVRVAHFAGDKKEEGKVEPHLA